MSALPFPEYGIRELYLFPYYETRESFRQETGIEPPPFDESRPPQYWFDPQAASSAKRNVVYDNVLALNEIGNPIRDEEGRPVLEVLLLKKEHAAAVNIPRKEVANEPGTSVPSVPVPLRPLAADESLAFDPWGNVVVRNMKLWAAPVAYGKYDRDMLMAIARKLNVNL